MSWRSILISQGGKLSLFKRQLLIQQKESEFTVPLEDIAIIVVESRDTVITVPLLSALAQNGITLLSCDEQFLPCGQWLPFNQYYRQLKTLKLQLEMSQPLKKKLWKTIVQQKIRNQAFVLEQIQSLSAAKKLKFLVERVKSGDKDNIEAQAAIVYFQSLFGQEFHRSDDDHLINAHLNYAYTVLRSAVARSLVLYGWLPQLGLFHHSELNPFNLADDVIEPFRPMVDLMVRQLWSEEKLSINLMPQAKQQLIKILYYQMQIHKQTLTVLAAIERTVSSLQSVLSTQRIELFKLPEMLPLMEHQYE